GVMYVLDEPSIGLHQRDKRNAAHNNQKIVSSRKLRRRECAIRIAFHGVAPCPVPGRTRPTGTGRGRRVGCLLFNRHCQCKVFIWHCKIKG
ncbi:hypothetical protein C9393_04675, partial [Xanthomonas vasicola pv. vasculorum]